MSLRAEGETIREKQKSKIKRQNDRVFTNLTPFIPLSLLREGSQGGGLLNNIKIKALNLDIRICLEFSALSLGFPDSDGGECP